jgi:hypothetical protein
MKGKTAFSALLLAGAALFVAAPARAEVAIGFSFGYDGGYFSDPCDYYNYYSEPPPWGLPPDYCDYPVYFEPVFWDGYWYRGPIYYRWYGGERLFWLNGGWRRDEWRGARPSIRWTDRGGWNRGRSGYSGGSHYYGNNNNGNRGDRGSWSNGGSHNWSGSNGGHGGSGGSRNWSGGGDSHNWSGGSGGHGWSGGSRNWSGGGDSHNWSGGSGGGHSWSGGSGGGGHSWSGGSGGHGGGDGGHGGGDRGGGDRHGGRH